MFKKLFSKSSYSLSDFAADIINEFRKQAYTGEIVWNADKKRLELGVGNHINLENLFQEQTSRSEDQRRLFLTQFVSETINKDESFSWEDIENRIFPRVRTLTELCIRKLYFFCEAEEGSDDVLNPSNYWSLGADLAIELVIDKEATIQSLPGVLLKEMGVSVEQAKAKAITNLVNMSQDLFEQYKPGIWVSPWKDNYDACRILLTDTINSLAVKGEAVIFIPNRDDLIIVGSDDTDGLRIVLELLNSRSDSGRILSLLPYRLKEDKIDYFMPSQEHPLFHEFSVLRAQTLIDEYAEQKTWMEKWFEKSQKDAFIATYTAIQKEDSGDVLSWATWSDGIPTYLPEVDMLALGRGETEKDYEILGFITWKEFQEKLADRIEETDYFPKRYRVQHFPDATVLTTLNFREL